LLPFHWAVKIGELTLTPRERALDECDRIVRDIAQPPGGRFKGMFGDLFCLSGSH
jgi:hypothetical protein